MDKLEIQKNLIEIMHLANETMGLLWTSSEAPMERTPYKPAQERQEKKENALRSSEDAPGEGAVLAQPGQKCYCVACKTDVYQVTQKVYGRNMGVNVFLNSFAPLGSAPVLSRDIIETVIRDEKGVIYVDCPLCKGEKCLALVGEVDRTAGQGGILGATRSEESPVESVGEEDVGFQVT